MKSFKIPLGILIAIIVLALLNGMVVEKQCSAWEKQAEEMLVQVKSENWPAALEIFENLQSSWDSWSDYLHVIMVHDEAEVVDTQLKECRVLLDQQNRDTLALTVAQLNCQLEHLGDLQSLSLSNLL